MSTLTMSPATPSPLATVKAYRRTGCAVITIERNGRVRRHTVSLRRYRTFYFWTIKKCPWKCNGAWMRHGMDIRVLREMYGMTTKTE